MKSSVVSPDSGCFALPTETRMMRKLLVYVMEDRGDVSPCMVGNAVVEVPTMWDGATKLEISAAFDNMKIRGEIGAIRLEPKP